MYPYSQRKSKVKSKDVMFVGPHNIRELINHFSILLSLNSVEVGKLPL